VEHLDELIAGHALHALEDDDARRVADHLAGCERCRARLRDMEAVAGALAYAAPPAVPPPALRDSLLAAIDGDAVAAPAPRRSPAREWRWWWWPRIAAVATPALALAVAALLAWNMSLRGDASDTEATLARGTPVHIAGVGTAVRHDDGRITLFADLPPAPADRVYEAWVIADDAPRPAGLFEGGAPQRITLTEQAEPGDVIAVTLELESADHQTPRGEPVGQGEVQAS
jgi:hypothetical protein